METKNIIDALRKCAGTDCSSANVAAAAALEQLTEENRLLKKDVAKLKRMILRKGALRNAKKK